MLTFATDICIMSLKRKENKKMKKIVLMAMAVMLLAAPVQAQENTETFEEAVTG